MITRRDIGLRVRQARKSQNMNQQVLADSLGVSRPTVVNIECGRLPVDTDRLNLLCTALNRDLAYFLDQSVEMSDTVDVVLSIPRRVYFWWEEVYDHAEREMVRCLTDVMESDRE